MKDFFRWVKWLFFKEADVIEQNEKSKNIGIATNATIISFSDASYTSSMAAKICIGKSPENDYTKMLNHIERIVNRTHESVIAQSNIILLLSFSGDKKATKFLNDHASALHFLEYEIKTVNDTYYVLIGGSIRAYKYYLRNAKDINDEFYISIKYCLYNSAESVFYSDIISDGIMDKNKFTYKPNAEVFLDYDKDLEDEVATTSKIVHQKITYGDRVDIIYADNVYNILDKVRVYGFTIKDVLKVAACTIVFHDVSRVISQQMVRHIAGISQESQRYVDYRNCKFIDPIQYNEKADKNKQYLISLFGANVSATSMDLGQDLISVYNQLEDQGMLKEEARGYLPFNAPAKLMMTFTYHNLIHFIKERTSKVAQAEIRSITEELKQQLATHESCSSLFLMNNINNLIDIVETPLYKSMNLENEIVVDEVINEEDV